MKRKLSLVLCLVILCVSCLGFTALAETTGTGTEGDPFIITTAEEFEAIVTTPATHYRLGGNITLNSYTTKTNFKGTLDGNGFTITINNGTAPLFTYSSTVNTAVIKNINLAGTLTLSAGETAVLVGYNYGAYIYNCTNNVSITHTAGGYCGSIVGRMLGGTVEKCTNNKDITFAAANCGGIVGYLQSGTVTNCVNNGNISATVNNIGGIVGRSHSGAVITNCYNTGNVSGNAYVGGILSTAAEATSISNCFNTGSITGSTAGGIAGTASGSETTINYCYNSGSLSASNAIISNLGSAVLTSCYYLSETGAAGKTGSSPLTTAQMSDKVNYATNFSGWDFENVWTFNTTQNNSYKYPQLKGMTFNVEYPEGTVNNPIKITSQADFEAIKADEDLYYIIENDFEMISPVSVASFAGVLDGNGKTITITNGTVSLFTASSGTIKNLTTTGNVSLSASKAAIYVGINSGKIENCKNNATLTTTSSHNGVFAGQSSGSITNCINLKDITLGQKYSGGIAGYNTGTISYCGNEGNITGGSIEIGGIIGQHQGGNIEYCYNIGDVSGKYDIGGIIGKLTSTAKISNSFNEGDIKATDANTSAAGGIVGTITKANTEIANCYNAGSVVSRYTKASVAAAFYHSLETSAGCTLTNCYYLDKADEGTAISGSVALSEAQMKDTVNYSTNFANWDFANVWQFNKAENNSYKYPQLKGLTFEVPYVLGEEGNPILINTASDFATLNGSDKYFRINADNIELTGAYSVESFSGNLDGNGKTIKITNGTTPLFTTIEAGATVSNLSIEGSVNFSAERFGTVANKNKGTIYNVKNYASVTSDYPYSAGIAGENTGRIEKCINYADLTFSKSNAGGIVAYNNGTVIFCGNEGTITNTAGSGATGGIIGLSYASFSDCYNTGLISGGDGVGGIAGRISYNSTKTISNCYNAGNIISSASKYSGGIIGDIPAINGEPTISVIGCYNQGAIMHVTVDRTATQAICGKTVNPVTVNGCYYLSKEPTEEGNIQGIVKGEFDKKVESFGIELKGLEDIEKPSLYSQYEGTVNILLNKDYFAGKTYYNVWNKPVVLSYGNINYGVSGYSLTSFGFVISRTDSAPEIDKDDCKNINMEYITPKGNCSVMAYGEYITEGESYYVRPYAVYTYLGEAYTVYGDAASFTAVKARP